MHQTFTVLTCKIPSEFCLLSWPKDNDIYIDTLKDTDLIFGKFDIRDDFTIINHILLRCVRVCNSDSNLI